MHRFYRCVFDKQKPKDDKKLKIVEDKPEKLSCSGFWYDFVSANQGTFQIER